EYDVKVTGGLLPSLRVCVVSSAAGVVRWAGCEDRRDLDAWRVSSLILARQGLIELVELAARGQQVQFVQADATGDRVEIYRYLSASRRPHPARNVVPDRALEGDDPSGEVERFRGDVGVLEILHEVDNGRVVRDAYGHAVVHGLQHVFAMPVVAARRVIVHHLPLGAVDRVL